MTLTEILGLLQKWHPKLRIEDELCTDVSFQLTTFILLHNRTSEVNIRLLYDCSRDNEIFNHYAVEGYLSDLAVFAVDDDNGYNNMVKIMNGCPDWYMPRDLELYTSNAGYSFTKAKYYINATDRKTIVIFRHYSAYMQYMHWIQHILSRLLPWYFESKPIAEDEMNFCIAIAANAKLPSFNECFDRFFSQKSFVREIAQANATKIVDMFSTDIIDSVREQLKDITDKINEEYEKYMNYIKESEELNIRLNGLIAGQTGMDPNELANYLICNPNIDIQSSEYGAIATIVSGHLTNVNADDYEVIRSTQNSFLYCKGRDWSLNEAFAPEENRLLIMDTLFNSNPQYKVRTCGFYKLTSTGVRTDVSHVFGRKYENFLPNPHLDAHRCLGEYGPIISDCMRNMDITGALDTCIASVSSMNINESVTVMYFMKCLFGRYANKRCIEDSTGKLYTPIQVLEILGGKVNETNSNDRSGDRDGDQPIPF